MTPRLNTTLSSIIDESAVLQTHHGRYEAMLFMLLHRVRWRLIARILAPLAPRRPTRIRSSLKPQRVSDGE